MNWINCISAKRTGYTYSSSPGLRSDYQRDYDRLIFSTAFRRLQNKTQVFPLPGSSTFVHNRLTHSLEVASVGRSLGSVVGHEIAADLANYDDAAQFYRNDLQGVIGAACLAHDVGNPAFGHSGEKAISNFFIQNEKAEYYGKSLKAYFSEKEWADVINFEGNANALRVLTKHFAGKLSGGLALTFTTLASILKYPCESSAQSKSNVHTKKYGFFQSELQIFDDIVADTFMKEESSNPIAFKRHPYVYLVEAADDICYRIVDMEDAHRLKILSTELVSSLFIEVLTELARPEIDIDKVKKTIRTLDDENERIAYLRAKLISGLVNQSAEIFKFNKSAILEGSYTSTLMDDVEVQCQALKTIEQISIDRIYNHHSVIKVELAGYKVMYGLLEVFIPCVLSEEPKGIDKKSFSLIPSQFIVKGENKSAYDRVMGVMDFVSGMTDDYAIEMYRNIMGIEIATHSV